MKIVDVKVIPFRVHVDRYRNGEPQPRTEVIQTLTRIVTDEGAEGYYFGGQGHGDQDGLQPPGRAYMEHRIKSMLVGEDPFDREKFWQWMWASKTPEYIVGVTDMALWDLLGRVAGLPVHKLLGGCRDKVKAYASTYPNMGMPENYAEHALACKRQGYKAYKIHPYYYWNPATQKPVPGRPSHVEWDIEVCRLVRAAVGDDMVLMYDPWGTYHIYEEALRVGRELEKLSFSFYEHPMPEYRVEPYVRLCRELSIPICSPEITEGNVFTRADWILRGASDMSRIDVLRGGITAVMKTVAVCEAYGVKCEIHMSGLGNLQVLGATSEDTCEYYERGLLAPGVNYDAPLPYLAEPADPLDADGYVRVPQAPGLGYQIVWDYIQENRVEG
ncbi:MAG: enolase [Chloroflexi bacterium]|nr:enolase [Chloroflexota bacterium]